MKESTVRKVLAVLLGLSVAAVIIWNIMEAELLIIGLNK